jgi:uncharacterized protein (TIGR02118 family)
MVLERHLIRGKRVASASMIRVSILYPRSEGTTFDIDYYVTKHIPLAQREMGDALKAVAVDEGVGGDNPAPYFCIGHLSFDSTEDFVAAIGAATETANDVPNFTNATPQLQISEVRL